MQAIERIRRAVRAQRYRVSAHANEEMDADALFAEDIESVILTGRIARKLTRDPRGTRYEVVGETSDGRHAHVVCRFLPSRTLLVITAWAADE
jgi:hypothetical protein